MLVRRLALVWLCILIPMSAAGLSGGPDGLVPHVLFHLLYIPLVLLTMWPIVRLRATARGVVRVLATIVAAVYPLAAIGQIGETVVAIAHGGLHPTAEVFDEPAHMAFAGVGGLALFLTLFLMSALSIVAGIRLLRAGDRAGWLALAPGIVFPLEMIVAVAGFIPSRSMVGTTLCALVVGILALRTGAGTSALVSRDAASV
ncbi:MAG: hypothetical protein JST33_03695 [Actinobacteria bacterium]|nr:hypothetical protein [Actinomycetota bacterium]